MLALGPAVDLIEEEDSLAIFLIVFLCFRDDPDDIFFLREYGRKVVELRIERVRDDTSDTRLSASWRSPEEDRWHTSCFYEFPDRSPFSDKVLLPDQVT